MAKVVMTFEVEFSPNRSGTDRLNPPNKWNWLAKFRNEHAQSKRSSVKRVTLLQQGPIRYEIDEEENMTEGYELVAHENIGYTWEDRES